MKVLPLFLVMIISLEACNGTATNETTATITDSVFERDTLPVKEVEKDDDDDQPDVRDTITDDTDTAKVYSNKRFRNVRVKKVSEGVYAIRGKAQVFEASFSWVVEDGHNELLQGHEMTDAGAPEWGKFNFKVKVNKKTSNSTLHLILFEVSAKDGSRQHELPIPLQ
jgi:hypothetical protein